MAHDLPTATAESNHESVRRVLWGVLFVNLLVAGLKGTVAVITGSVAAMAEVVHGILDASANVIGIIGLSFAKEPPDAQHPYGHHRFEALAALGIGVLIAAGLVEIVRALWDGVIGERAAPVVSAVSAGMLVATIVINFGISYYEGKRGKELNSRLLKADAAHTLSDGMGVIVVLTSFAGVHFGFRWADTIAAVIVAFLIGRTALRVVRDNAEALLDTAQVDPAHIYDVALGVPGVRGAHAIRSRGMEGRVSVDLHIQVDPKISVTDAHRITHGVKTALLSEIHGLCDVVIHTEPADGRELTSQRPKSQPLPPHTHNHDHA